MEKKYYTPSIEEFHVGFEFEVLNDKDKFYLPQYEVGDWINMSVSWGIFSDFQQINRLLIDSQIRVKCLDREDIESFGWDSNLDVIGYGIDTEKGIYWCRPFLNSDYTVALIELLHNGRCIFFGKIRNKSELEIIMRMIGIKK